MHQGLLTLLLLGSAAAVPEVAQRATRTSLDKPVGSSVPLLKSASNARGGKSEHLTKDGWWHWLPGGGNLPGWNPGHGHCKTIQHRFSPLENSFGESHKRAEAIKQYYVDSWNQYAEYAFGKDGFNPVAKTGSNGGGGWGLIIIDGIDTAITMGLKDIVDRQLEWISQQDFTTSTDPMVDGFDTTIRLIGGLLSAFDLISSGLVPHAKSYNKDHVKSLLTAARDLADLITPLFDSPTGLPYFWLNMTTNEPYDTNINTAIAGTIILEYHRLSDLTGDDKYRKQADKAEEYLLKPEPATVFPNLVGSTLDILTGKFTGLDAGWQSGIDSFYEYLIKSVVYDPKQPLAKEYEDFWVTAVESTIDHLVVHPHGYEDVTFITQLNATGAPLWAMDDYACFAGGNFLLGGAYLGRKDIHELGLAVTDSCHLWFNTTASGLNPLRIAWYGPDGLAANPAYNGDGETAKEAKEYYDKAGGYFIDTEQGFGTLYTLYPEPIESIMYAYRITGDKKWQDYNWEIFNSIKKAADRDGVVVSSLWDVTQPNGGDRYADVPSYYYAETLKYLYLTFTNPSLVSLDDFQFNTEGHPLRVQGGTCSTEHKPSLLDWIKQWLDKLFS